MSSEFDMWAPQKQLLTVLETATSTHVCRLKPNTKLGSAQPSNQTLHGFNLTQKKVGRVQPIPPSLGTKHILNVWRVVSEDIKSNDQQDKQHDVTAKCIILSSLSDNVFNRVYSCENAKELWKTIIENHEGTENVAK